MLLSACRLQVEQKKLTGNPSEANLELAMMANF